MCHFRTEQVVDSIKPWGACCRSSGLVWWPRPALAGQDTALLNSYHFTLQQRAGAQTGPASHITFKTTGPKQKCSSPSPIIANFLSCLNNKRHVFFINCYAGRNCRIHQYPIFPYYHSGNMYMEKIAWSTKLSSPSPKAKSKSNWDSGDTLITWATRPTHHNFFTMKECWKEKSLSIAPPTHPGGQLVQVCVCFIPFLST